MEYNPQEIELKWQKYWQEADIFKVREETGKSKYYLLEMFPYPWGASTWVMSEIIRSEMSLPGTRQ